MYPWPRPDRVNWYLTQGCCQARVDAVPLERRVLQLDELIAAVMAERAAAPLLQLQRAFEVAGDLASTTDDLMDHFVDEARRAGCSWAEIGSVLGVSRQGAQQRFGSFADAADRACDQEEAPVTPRVRKALRQASREARRVGMSEVDPSHLLLALLRDPHGLATKALTSMGVAPGDVEAGLDLRTSATAGRRATPRVSASTAAVLGRALEEARARGHEYVGTEHLLLGLLATPSPARDVIVALGGDHDEARRHVLTALEAPVADLRRGRVRAARQPA